jgi:hypothetical protein
MKTKLPLYLLAGAVVLFIAAAVTLFYSPKPEPEEVNQEPEEEKKEEVKDEPGSGTGQET